ncbi:hypothetical protein ABEW32_11475 [Paenibacillus jamilae]|uniref:hypothetical protein n=1 Tax=Paenibacillus TaxID=44249 RepID=UPI000FAB0160|nr:hypothetical protein [Paenibacillus polymyxa]KAF6636541.1 hypothetical protein H6F38_04690 [Paenibacillus sp. EKM208P]MDY7993347.1 hypothetical protein [Paenibacillus polymyxa]MDY8120052.1 hypothetical protein [Paenibacillus polymyxa]
MKPHEQLEAELSAENMLKILPALLGMYGPVAFATKAYFDQLVSTGFSEAQALHIVSAQGITARLGGGQS